MELEPDPEPVPRKARWRRFLVISAAVGVLMTVGQSFATTYDVRGVDGLPIERATVLATRDTGEGGCGKGDDPRDFHIRSDNPPAGLPDEFWARDECHPAVSAGDKIPLAREVRDGKIVKYWINPTTSYAEAFWLSLGTGAMFFVLTLVVLWLGHGLLLVWRRHSWHD